MLSVKDQAIHSDDGSSEPNYCPICYSNEIVAAPAPIDDMLTWEFSCGHRFCLDCTRENLRLVINDFQPDKLICLQHECGKKVTMAELNELFQDVEPETI